MNDALKRSLIRLLLWIVLLTFVWMGYAWATPLALTVIFLYVEAKGLVYRMNITTVHENLAELRDEIDELRSNIETVDEKLEAAISHDPEEET